MCIEHVVFDQPRASGNLSAERFYKNRTMNRIPCPGKQSLKNFYGLTRPRCSDTGHVFSLEHKVLFGKRELLEQIPVGSALLHGPFEAPHREDGLPGDAEGGILDAGGAILR